MPFDFNPNTILLNTTTEVPIGQPNSDGRMRFIRNMWPRSRDGVYLEKDHGPLGFRTPNGEVWGHSLDELGYIQRDPNIPGWVTVYSRSQIKELGENYDDDVYDEPLTRPRVRRPWPVLKLPRRHPANTDPPLGAIDGGCEEEHADPEERTYIMRWDEFSDDKTSGKATLSDSDSKGKAKKEETKYVRPPLTCSADPSQPCRGRLIPNDGPEPRPHRAGYAYDYIWCKHFVARLKAHKDPFRLVAGTIHNMNQPRLAADADGLLILSETLNSRDVLVCHAGASPRGYGDLNNFLAAAEDSIPGRPAAELELVLPDVEPEEGEGGPGMTGDNSGSKDDDVFMDEEGLSDQRMSDMSESEKERVPQHAPGLFSTQDLPKLEEFIPEALFPDILLVHDPHKLTNHSQPGSGSGDVDSEDEPIKYKRIYPVLPSQERKGAGELVAHLHLHPTNRFGQGHHSYVYRAPLTLPAPLSARSRTGQCTVAAKLAYARCTAHRLLRNEGKMYAALPKHTQEEYCGYNVIRPCRHPVPVGAIVPKFYGYYLPVEEGSENEGGGAQDMEEEWREHAECDQYRPCRVKWASPILLMEECGQPVQPEKFTPDQRTECFSLILRLNVMNIIQGSFYVRNVMIQPGPLTAPPSLRSFDWPSFRIIDFGRGEMWGSEERKRQREGWTKEEVAKAYDSWHCKLREELADARRALLLEQHTGF